jgi:hypothetical protein
MPLTPAEINAEIEAIIGKAGDFYHSLDACAEFERTIQPMDWYDYAKRIRIIIQRDCNKPECYDPGCAPAVMIADIWFYCATAPQRCEAFLRLHGKWVE